MNFLNLSLAEEEPEVSRLNPAVWEKDKAPGATGSHSSCPLQI